VYVCVYVCVGGGGGGGGGRVRMCVHMSIIVGRCTYQSVNAFNL